MQPTTTNRGAARVTLMTDSPCDLSREFLDAHGVIVARFSYAEAEKADGGLTGMDDMFESRSAHEFYDAIRRGAMPMTSQPSPAEFDAAYRTCLATGLPTVYLCFSSGISGCYEGACAARDRLAEEYAAAHGGAELPITVVDTRMASAAQALYIVEAIARRDEGLSAQEMVAWAHEATAHDHMAFMVDDLACLARGGRIPPAAAKIGGALGVKPLLTIGLDGKLGLTGVARGRRKALRKFVETYRDARLTPDANGEVRSATGARFSNTVVIGEADCPDDLAFLEEGLRRVDPDVRIVVSTVGPTIGCHVGPGMMACCFWGADRRAATK